MSGYFSQTSDADAIAATILRSLIPAYLALTGSTGDVATKTAALLTASGDVDEAFYYQGRRYDTLNQVNEFPRVAREPSTVTIPNIGVAMPGTPWGVIVWDLDPVTS